MIREHTPPLKTLISHSKLSYLSYHPILSYLTYLISYLSYFPIFLSVLLIPIFPFPCRRHHRLRCPLAGWGRPRAFLSEKEPVVRQAPFRLSKKRRSLFFEQAPPCAAPRSSAHGGNFDAHTAQSAFCRDLCAAESGSNLHCVCGRKTPQDG